MWYVISIGVGALMLFYPKAHKPEKFNLKVIHGLDIEYNTLIICLL